MKDACITCLLYCANDVNVFYLKDVLDHMTADLLPLFTSKRLPHMIFSVSNESVHKGNLWRCF